MKQGGIQADNQLGDSDRLQWRVTQGPGAPHPPGRGVVSVLRPGGRPRRPAATATASARFSTLLDLPEDGIDGAELVIKPGRFCAHMAG